LGRFRCCGIFLSVYIHSEQEAPDAYLSAGPGSRAFQHPSSLHHPWRSALGIHLRGGSPLRKTDLPLCQPGHDPQVRLTRRVDGKTVAESFSSPAAWRKAQAEIEEYHRFQRLIAELIAINEKICLQRPRESPDGAWTPEEKKRLLRSLTRSLAK